MPPPPPLVRYTGGIISTLKDREGLVDGKGPDGWLLVRFEGMEKSIAVPARHLQFITAIEGQSVGR